MADTDVLVQGVWRCFTCGWIFEGRCITAMNDAEKKSGISLCRQCAAWGKDDRGYPTGVGSFERLTEIEEAVWRTGNGT